MNIWILNMVPVLVRVLLWLTSFTPAERVALSAAFLVFLGVIGEEVAELKVLEEKVKALKAVKRWAIALLLIGLAGDVVGIVMGQTEMSALTREAGDAQKSAEKAEDAAGRAKTEADGAEMDAKNAHDLAQSASAIATPAKATADAVKVQADILSTQNEKLRTRVKGEDDALTKVDEKRQELEAALTNLAVCNTPRVIDLWYVNGKSAVDDLRPFSSSHALLMVLNNDESERAAAQIVAALNDARWPAVKRIPPDEIIPDGVTVEWYTGLGSHVRDFDASPIAKAAAEAVRDFLHANNWQASAEDAMSGHTAIPPGGILISVGLYPPTRLIKSAGEVMMQPLLEKIEKESRENGDVQPCRPLSDFIPQQ